MKEIIDKSWVDWVTRIKLLLIFSLLTISCHGQNKENQNEVNPYNQQYNAMIGKWELINSEHPVFDTLVLFESGDYLKNTSGIIDKGEWNIIDVHHLTLDDDQYRFFFQSKKLILVNEQGIKHELSRLNLETSENDPSFQITGQISQFVRRIFQDKTGDLWFGTNGDGVIRFNGETLEYFSIYEGFSGVAVRAIVEDNEGNIWFGTEGGLSRYKPVLEPDPTTGEGHRRGRETFTNYTTEDGLIHNDIWSLEIDNKGIIWIGTFQGVCRFDGEEFTPFEIPESKADSTRGVTSPWIIHSIMEDSRGRMWFGTNGGAYIYDKKLTLAARLPSLQKQADFSAGQAGLPAEQAGLYRISEKDGLCNNSVNCILEDRNGNIWFATHHAGVCVLDLSTEQTGGTKFTHISTEHGVNGTEAWDLYEDKAGNIWFPIEGYGIYRYDPSAAEASLPIRQSSFTNFNKTHGLSSNALQCSFEDMEGRLWFGGYMGLFRYDPSIGQGSFFNVTRSGPWQ